MSAPSPEVEIREATGEAVTDAVSVLEAAMLEIDPDRVRTLAGDGDGAALVAVGVGSDALAASERVVLGALVLDRREVTALAVRPRRRGQGIGSALVRTASERVDGPLVATFDADLRPFYEHLGFAVERSSEERYRAQLDSDQSG
jgi:GNAT superfamily N-acetyltransferase